MLIRTPDLGLVEATPTRTGSVVRYLKVGLTVESPLTPAEVRDTLISGAPVAP